MKTTNYKDGKGKIESKYWKLELRKIKNKNDESRDNRTNESRDNRTFYEIRLPDVLSRSEVVFTILVRSNLQSHMDIGES